MIRRISLALATLAVLATAACSNPTAPNAKAPTTVAHDEAPVQGSGI